MNISTNEIRQIFLDFFCDKGHQIIESSSLIPINDPTLLFTNSGMNQFKDVFLGLEEKSYKRAVTVQNCMRAGGKHNDLEEVGYTPIHHTFFEMLGNFSFGDYFKYDAINFAWELLTHEKWFNISKEKLWITVNDNDNETYNIWTNKIGIPRKHVIRIRNTKMNQNNSDNFWQMGDVGPCGPCSEIFYDHGHHVIGDIPGGLKNRGYRYVEIWNLVFMQFNKQFDGTLIPLPKLSIDTGMGLERISAILQNVNNNYEIDIFRQLIISISQILNVKDLNNNSLQIIADHMRACCFLINDGVTPSNTGRGYVLRRIIRRAMRHGYILHNQNIFLCKLVEPLSKIISNSNKLYAKQDLIKHILYLEESNFINSMKRGLFFLKKTLSHVNNNLLDGHTAFFLYDTYGFPLDFTIDVCREYNIKVDKLGFQNKMLIQKQNSHKSSCFSKNFHINNIFYINKETKFLGYRTLESQSIVTALLIDNQPVEILYPNRGKESVIVLNATPFHGESSGQIGDRGKIESNDSIFNVMDTKQYGKIIVHLGKLDCGEIKIGAKVNAIVDQEHRYNICMNHSATHMLHTVLRLILGENIKQSGSAIHDQYFNFDFTHDKVITFDQIHQIENVVNNKIRCNLLVTTKTMSLNEAINAGAIALFNEKYNKQQVRVVNIGDFSVELCSGTHVKRTGDIGMFHIVSESNISSGIHRIKAVTGAHALEILHKQSDILYEISHLIKSDNKNIVNNILKLTNNVFYLEKQLKILKNNQIKYESSLLNNKIRNIHGIKVLIHKVHDIEIKTLRIMVDNLKNKFGSLLIILVNISHNKINLIVGVTKDLIHLIQANDIVNCLINRINGCKGGGHSHLAHAGGMDQSNCNAIMQIIDLILTKKLH